MLSKSTFGIAAAGAGLCFVGYCFYFDKKRRSDPDFQEKIKEKRRKNAKTGASSGKASAASDSFPDPTNEKACQAYFMQEIQLGEMMIATGDLDAGTDHLANGVVVCGQPQHLMQILAQTLPPEVVQLLALKIPVVKKRMQESMEAKLIASGGQMPSANMPQAGPKITELAEDDVE